MKDLKTRIQELSKAIHQDTIAIRRHIHENPELSFQEVKTARYIADQLQKLGIEHEHGVADTGVVGIIKGRNPGKKVIALRSDHDALPITEANEVDYKSNNDGVMHACGHDVHTSSLLGTARILHELKDEFEGTVKLIFQPGEEKAPGGASLMIKDGVLENPTPTLIFGQHVHPPLEVGKVGMKGGLYMASTDELYVSVKGKGGHGASPNTCIDPVVITAQILIALQQVVSRYCNPIIPSVLTFGKINSVGGATNVIPEEVRLEGTFRTMNEEWRAEAKQRMKEIAEGIAKSMGATCDFNIVHGYPFLINNEELTAKAKLLAIEYLGKEKVEDLPMRMAGEDFAFYSHRIPAVFYRLGIRNEDRGITSGLHTPTFDIDENALAISTGLMAWMAISNLN